MKWDNGGSREVPCVRNYAEAFGKLRELYLDAARDCRASHQGAKRAVLPLMTTVVFSAFIVTRCMATEINQQTRRT